MQRQKRKDIFSSDFETFVDLCNTELSPETQMQGPKCNDMNG